MTDETAPAPETAGQDRAESPLATAEDEFRARLEAENAELKDRLLRTLADLDNLRKRTEREVADARAYAVTAFARDLLPVADNLGRALEAISGEGMTPEAALKSLSEGVGMTERDQAPTDSRAEHV